MNAIASTLAENRRQRAHAAVRELMAEQGFRISMDAVAARVGCSKQTLYAQFGSKQALLRSVIDSRLHRSTEALRADASPREVLLGFAREHLLHLSEPTVAATCQLLGASAREFPEEAQDLYRDGCDALQRRLADWLALAMQRGQLRHDQPHYAAELLLGMIVGLDLERQRFAVPHRAGSAERERWAEYAVDAFLRAFTPINPGAADPAVHRPDHNE